MVLPIEYFKNWLELHMIKITTEQSQPQQSKDVAARDENSKIKQKLWFCVFNRKKLCFLPKSNYWFFQ